MHKIKFQLTVLAIAGTFLFAACSKEKGVENGTLEPGVDTSSMASKVKDTALMIAEDIYLWYQQIPANFDARKYADPGAIMEAIRQYSVEPGFPNPVDRWSFGMKKEEWDNVAGGIAKDFGLNIFFLEDGDLRVRSVDENSPAGQAGVRRGWRITKINNSTNMTIANADFIVDNVYYSDQATFTFAKPDGTNVTLPLGSASYIENPIYLDTVYNINNKNVGYMVYNSFLGEEEPITNKFAEVFQKFSDANVTEMIIDLRYNGGGYVSLQDKLANYLAPSSANGDVMMSQEFNNKYSVYNSTTKFEKIGNLNLSRIFFIVSGSTASASELLINNLKPFMDVKVVGPEWTYGKPVGYFNIPVGDWYVFPVSFRSTNKNGSGNYFDGIQTDKQVGDGIDKDWGDVNEASLSSILRYINTGSFGFAGERPGVAARDGVRDGRVKETNQRIDRVKFRGMIAERPF